MQRRQCSNQRGCYVAVATVSPVPFTDPTTVTTTAANYISSANKLPASMRAPSSKHRYLHLRGLVCVWPVRSFFFSNSLN